MEHAATNYYKCNNLYIDDRGLSCKFEPEVNIKSQGLSIEELKEALSEGFIAPSNRVFVYTVSLEFPKAKGRKSRVRVNGSLDARSARCFSSATDAKAAAFAELNKAIKEDGRNADGFVSFESIEAREFAADADVDRIFNESHKAVGSFLFSTFGTTYDRLMSEAKTGVEKIELHKCESVLKSRENHIYVESETIQMGLH